VKSSSSRRILISYCASRRGQSVEVRLLAFGALCASPFVRAVVSIAKIRGARAVVTSCTAATCASQPAKRGIRQPESVDNRGRSLGMAPRLSVARGIEFVLTATISMPISRRYAGEPHAGNKTSIRVDSLARRWLHSRQTWPRQRQSSLRDATAAELQSAMK